MKKFLLVLTLLTSSLSFACGYNPQELDDKVAQKISEELNLKQEDILSGSVLYLLRFEAPKGSACPEAYVIYHGVYVKKENKTCAVGTKVQIDQNAGIDVFKILSVECE